MLYRYTRRCYTDIHANTDIHGDFMQIHTQMLHRYTCRYGYTQRFHARERVRERERTRERARAREREGECVCVRLRVCERERGRDEQACTHARTQISMFLMHQRKSGPDKYNTPARACTDTDTGTHTDTDTHIPQPYRAPTWHRSSARRARPASRI